MMIKRMELPVDKIIPTEKEILSGQGIPVDYEIKENVRQLLNESLYLLKVGSKPECIFSEISKTEFSRIFNGEGDNEDDNPLKKIYPEAEYLFLFALTLGKEISEKITVLFKDNDFALGAMLDTAASIAADKSVQLLENLINFDLTEKKLIKTSSMTLSYSPGYCGWNISGQKKLFSAIQPEQIGISLNDSFLMTPLKSVTGVLVCGSKHIHNFENSFGFCSNCKSLSCIERREKVLSY